MQCAWVYLAPLFKPPNPNPWLGILGSQGERTGVVTILKKCICFVYYDHNEQKVFVIYFHLQTLYYVHGGPKKQGLAFLNPR